MPPSRNADTPHRAGVHHPLHTRRPRGFEHVARAFDIGTVQFGGIPRPEPVIGGDMVDHPAARHGAGERNRVAQIAVDRFSAQFPQLAARPHEGADGLPAVLKQPGDVPSQEPGGAGNESRLHRRSPRTACLRARLSFT